MESRIGIVRSRRTVVLVLFALLAATAMAFAVARLVPAPAPAIPAPSTSAWNPARQVKPPDALDRDAQYRLEQGADRAVAPGDLPFWP